ncbi:MAG: DMT family transporter [Bacteroidales bacterium]|nr:DMT family transporter [Bacteroidales bacterium]MBQ2598967.1 DMT family transporter [Bacteroidales bacterium]MBQ4013035.1 DMT family transporter [Bacteroidales bacterium]
MSEKGKGLNLVWYLLILLTVFLWGMSFLWSDRVLDRQVPVFTFIFTRMIIAAAALSLFSLLTGRFQRIRKGDFKWFAAMTAFEPFLYFLGETFGLQLTDSPTLCSVIIATIPVFSLVVGWILFREKLSTLNRAGIFVAVAGVILFVLIGGSLHAKYLYGIAILFLAAIGSTGYTAICKKLANKGYNPFAIVTWQFILAIGYFLVPFLIWDASSWTPAYLSWPVLRPIIALAVLCSGVAFVIYAACVDRIGMTRTTVFLPLVAIVSAVAASLLGQDTLEPLQFVGIAVAMLGVVMAQASFKKEKDNEA